MLSKLFAPKTDVVAEAVAQVAALNESQASSPWAAYAPLVELLSDGVALDSQQAETLASSLKALNKDERALDRDVDATRRFKAVCAECIGWESRRDELAAEQTIAQDRHAAARNEERSARLAMNSAQWALTNHGQLLVGRDARLAQDFELLRHTKEGKELASSGK